MQESAPIITLFQISILGSAERNRYLPTAKYLNTRMTYRCAAMRMPPEGVPRSTAIVITTTTYQSKCLLSHDLGTTYFCVTCKSSLFSVLVDSIPHVSTETYTVVTQYDPVQRQRYSMLRSSGHYDFLVKSLRHFNTHPHALHRLRSNPFQAP